MTPCTPEPSAGESVLYVQSGEFLRRASLSNASLLADVYWIRAIQYYGGTRRAKQPAKNYESLYPLLDIATTLDPKFTIAYRFGAVFLAEKYPGGPGRPDLSIKLLEKGVRLDPAKWQYLQDLGFVYYWWQHDYEKAAAAFKRGADVPGAPVWMKSLAAATYGKGGDRQTSRMLWQQLYQTADNEWLHNNAALRLAQLDALDQIDQLERITSAWTRRTGAPPPSWQVLVRAGWLRGEPLDPAGFAYCSTRRPVGSPCAASRPCIRCRPNPGPGFHRRLLRERPDAGFPDARLCRRLRPRRGQLPERLHLPSATPRVARAARFPLHGVRPPPRLVRERAGGLRT